MFVQVIFKGRGDLAEIVTEGRTEQRDVMQDELKVVRTGQLFFWGSMGIQLRA